MANEFRIKHGLIVTGSSYFSESMFAPNLPEETAPDYYITWRSSDGRFEVTEVSPTTVATTIACWDYNTGGDPAAGEWATDPLATVGSSTNSLIINVVDNNGSNQNNLLSGIGVGSLLTLYVGAGLVTTFEVTSIQPIYGGSGIAQYIFEVTYVSGDQYSVVGTPEMCLEIAAAAPTNNNCLNFTIENTFDVSTPGDGTFFTNSGNVTTTADVNVAALILNNVDNNGVNVKNWFSSLQKGDAFSVNQKNNVMSVYFDSLGATGTSIQINVIQYSTTIPFTIPLGSTFDVCITPAN